uniref:Uncharacterized protein n=1 Tax=Anguilla anguilla TaxID=7936 RepID=A0A0E9R140_ANGAN
MGLRFTNEATRDYSESQQRLLGQKQQNNIALHSYLTDAFIQNEVTITNNKNKMRQFDVVSYQNRDRSQ